MAKKDKERIRVGNRSIEVSRLDKVFFPKTGFTKGDVIDYYTEIAPVVVPHLRGRPLTLKRYPDGVEGNFFYEKRCPPHRPEWINTVKVRRRRDDKDISFCTLDNKASLVWAANLANLELHVSLARAKDIRRPTSMVFDLDPGAPAYVVDCAQVALRLRDLFDNIGLDTYCKTSGSKGLQVYVPLNTNVDYDRTRPFANAVAKELEADDPGYVVSKMKKELRKGKVFIDWSQNADHKTTVCVYSLRAKPNPTASTPVTWDEVEHAAAKEKPELLSFEADEVLRRVDKHGDLFEPVLKQRQRLREF
ncbi:MAG: non-homologous end-joining DNA ligase [Actinomycetota bacterium]|nr:non-homologous end-joining DNA ligase [Actinomycetota bacterium]